MQQSFLLAIVAGASLIIGAGGTYVVTGNRPPSPVTSADIVAACKLDPAACEAAIGLEKPTNAEAQAAFNAADRASPLHYGGDGPEIGVKLGQCSKNTLGPGVQCMTNVKYTPQAQPQNRVVGFARSSDGQWVATLF